VQDVTNLNTQLEALQGYVKTQKALRKNKQTESHVLGVVGYLRMELADTSKRFQKVLETRTEVRCAALSLRETREVQQLPRSDPIASSFFLCISTGPQEAAGSKKVLHPHQFSCAHQGRISLSGKAHARVPQWVSVCHLFLHRSTAPSHGLEVSDCKLTETEHRPPLG